jgi:hypothetical protein
MAKCVNCGATVLFGGVKREELTFCSEGCFRNALLNDRLINIPDEVLNETVHSVHEGLCPICGGNGPVDIHFAHRVMSFLVVTQYQKRPRLSCQSCGTKWKIWNNFITFLLGWWGIPFGLAMTPIYLVCNLVNIALPVSTLEPSQHLIEHVKLQLGEAAMAGQDLQKQQNT